MSSKRVNIISLAFAKYVRPLRGRFVCIHFYLKTDAPTKVGRWPLEGTEKVKSTFRLKANDR